MIRSMPSRLFRKSASAALGRRSASMFSRAASKPIALRAIVACTRPILDPRSFALQSAATQFALRAYAVTTVPVPTMAESITEGTLKQWVKKVGDYVEQDEEVASIETDKIDVAVNAPAAGVITELLAEEESTVTVGQDLFKIDTEASGSSGSSSEAPKAAAKEETAPATPAPEAPKPATPEPPKAAAAPSPKASAPPPPPKAASAEPAQAAAAAPSPFGSREERRVKMNRMRLRIAERLKQSQNTAASLTTFNEVDMSSLIEFRKLYKDEILKKTGVKLGFMSAFSKAVCLAAKEIPAVNGAIEGPNGGDTIVYRDYIDISVAVATPKGLVTPVVRNAETMSMVEVEKAIADLGTKARDNKLTIEDMAGGTITISNGGVFGSMMGTPIINLPQTAVLGLHAIKDRPVAINGKVEIRPMMYLALTYDHRLLDGREAVTFLKLIKEFIEDPRKMLL
ncbi:hypothetical protein V1508DRAFT_283574 [Lipomyces doorenjongii]|uniref:uncharacterized protein n=1 Tax=Lipomyces doorenjongii TaxID=383834 RepID=UPI0034CE2399